MWFVVDEKDCLRGVYQNLVTAECVAGEADTVVEVDNHQLRAGVFEFVLAAEEEFEVPVGTGDTYLDALHDLVEEQAAEIDELYERLASLEQDFYGAEQPLLDANLDPGLADFGGGNEGAN